MSSNGHPCPYCDRREPTEHLLALHVGGEHWERCSATERERYQAAYDRESEELWRFRLQAVAVLVILYFGFLFLYSVVG
ncbi:MAG: C2H2-type zinc finger protein [Halanaeroarchaeum sp.]